MACGVVLTSPAAGACVSATVALASATLLASPGAWRHTCIVAALFMASMAHGAAARDRRLDAAIASFASEAGADAEARRVPVLVSGRIATDATAIDSGVRLLIDVHTIEDDH